MTQPTASKPTRDRAYGLSSRFERVVATLASRSPRFYGRVCTELRPRLIEAAPARLALEACHAIAADTGIGPSSSVIMLQRIQRWHGEGRVTEAGVDEVLDMLDDVEDAGLPTEDEVIAELAPVLMARLREEAVEAAMKASRKQTGLGEVIRLEERAARVGNVDTSIGVIVGDASFADIKHLRTLDRLKTGVMELDSVLSGGLQRAGLGVCIGASGDGKSMFLSHQAAVSAMCGLNVAAATLELPRAIWQARVIAAMTGLPINAVLDDTGMLKAQAKLKTLQTGAVVVHEFPPNGTSLGDITEWVRNVEQHIGQPIHVLIVDYGDKMVAPGGRSENSSSYEVGRVVFEGLRSFGAEKGLWTWTASQASRQSKKNKKLDLNDTADSMHKIRVADLVITMNLDEEAEMLSIYIAKHRTGKSRVEVGNLPMEYERGRIAPILFDSKGRVL
jgi:KaiC/GvpD/RAD55 family RecA-like ATPase